MCGIAGKVVFGRDDRVTREEVLAMADALAHRGADAPGLHVSRQVGLAYRRMDVGQRPEERQPIGDHAGSVWAVLDGQIDNAAELRTHLQRRGRVFCTTAGAEVLVQGYEQWGDRVVERLRGAFAFALSDERQARLLLGRDRVGVRPLCYALLDGRGLVFASELRALLEDPDVSRDWNLAAIKEYLVLGYVPSPGTVFSRIVRLPPAHVLTFDHGRVRLHRYWDLPAATQEQKPEPEYVAGLGERLAEVARVQTAGAQSFTVLLPPRPVPTALAAMLAGNADCPVVATTVAFDELPITDVQPARAIAKSLGLRHHSELITPRLAESVPALASHFDEPFADPSVVTTYHAMMAARAHGGLALGAAGSDLVWSAEACHRLEHFEARARRWLGPLVAAEADACARHRAAPQWRTYRLCSDDFLRATAGVDPLSSLKSIYRDCRARDGLARALHVDLKTRLVDQVLARIDRMSAAAGVQMRLPILDHQLVEFAATVPPHLKIRGGRPHYLFRQLLASRVPDELFAADPHGFEARPAAWLRGPLASMASDVLFSGRFRQRGLFDSRAVMKAWQAHITGHRDRHRELWSLLMLELWFERVIDGGERRQHAA